MAAGVFALVRLCLCHDIAPARARHGRVAAFLSGEFQAMPWPKVRSRRTTAVSPWISIIAREVEFSRGARRELYHAVAQADYIAIVALTPEGKIPIVRQYRPALEAFSWELPAGLVDAGETARACCRRELLEETGLTARSIHVLAHTFPCTGRLSNRIHSFFVAAGKRVSGFQPEPGVAVK